MPLRRSPPPPSATASTPGITSAVTQTYDSDTPSERSSSSNVFVRQKRRRDLDDDHKELKTEMSNLIKTLSNTFEEHFNELKQQNVELKTSLQFMSDKYDTILRSLSKLEEEKAKDRKTIIQLEEKIEILERKTKSTSLEIRNVPYSLNSNKNTESREEVCGIVKSLAHSVEVELKDVEIKDIYRITTNKDNIKPIFVELTSVIKKEKIIQGVKNFNKLKTNELKLNTGHLKIAGPSRPIYISEALTFKAQKLYYQARQFARENGYSYCWTSRGLVYLRRVEGIPPIRIDSEMDFTKISNKK